MIKNLMITISVLLFLTWVAYGQSTMRTTKPVYQYGPIRLTVREEPPQLIATEPNAVIADNDSVQWKPVKYFSIEKLDSKSQWVSADRFTESQRWN